MRDSFDTMQHKRTGRVHLIESVEGLPFTLCGHLARRDHYGARDHHMTEATCERCWTIVACRIPPRRRVEEPAAA